jgi:diacylglycerol kinase (ATP)
MPKPQTNPLFHLVAACTYSWKGITAAIRHEHAFRQELMVAIVALPLGLYLGNGMVEKLVLAGSWLVVMIVELLNSALEAVVDLVSPDYNKLAGQAKDLGSAAVLLAIVLAALCWIMILWDHVS